MFSQNCPAIPICASYASTPNGFGVQELNPSNDGCLNGEHNSTWLQVTILTGGTFNFIIDPNVNSNDFDYAVWGPNNPCPPNNQPVRCSYAIQGGNGNTGLNTTATDNSEGVFGDQWTSQINVLAGQTYLILVDNFTTNSGFNISFGGTATLNCLTLPIVMDYINCTSNDSGITLNWSTLSETNNWKFEIQRSNDLGTWETIGEVLSQNSNSSQPLFYTYIDNYPLIGYNYYRFKQIDYNGSFTYYSWIGCEGKEIIAKYQYYNLLGQEINKPKSGVFIQKTIIGDIVKYKTIYLYE